MEILSCSLRSERWAAGKGNMIFVKPKPLEVEPAESRALGATHVGVKGWGSSEAPTVS